MKRLKDNKGRTLEEFLAGYCPKDYPRPSVTADIVILSNTNNNYYVLLIKRNGHPFLDYWALPGGFAEENENVYETALRELMEETSLTNIPLEEIGLFSTPSRDPRSWTMTDAYFALADKEKVMAKAGDDAKDAKWFKIEVADGENQVTLTLSNEIETITITLEKFNRVGVTGNVVTFKTINNNGIAFDHGEIIAAALEKLGVISNNLLFNPEQSQM
jgi:ADP-ribose pyrophosphatase YjhB (NUDIX family)